MKKLLVALILLIASCGEMPIEEMVGLGEFEKSAPARTGDAKVTIRIHIRKFKKEQTMKIKVNENFKTLDGADAFNAPVDDKPGELATLKLAIINALLGTFPDEQQLSGVEKAERYNLALKVHNSSETVDVSAEEITLIKKLIGKAFSPSVVGQSYRMLEN